MEEMEGGSAMNSKSGGGSFGGSGSKITVMGACFNIAWERRGKLFDVSWRYILQGV